MTVPKPTKYLPTKTLGTPRSLPGLPNCILFPKLTRKRDRVSEGSQNVSSTKCYFLSGKHSNNIILLIISSKGNYYRSVLVATSYHYKFDLAKAIRRPTE